MNPISNQGAPMWDPFCQTWFLTWPTKGTWCPGDQRGWVSKNYGNELTEPVNPPAEGLRVWSLNQMKGSPVWLTRDQAEIVLNQFKETANFNEWWLGCVAIMSNHVHVVLGDPGGVTSDKLSGRLKAYASRALKLKWGKKEWWAASCSARLLKDVEAIKMVMDYVRNQAGVLVHYEADV